MEKVNQKTLGRKGDSSTKFLEHVYIFCQLEIMREGRMFFTPGKVMYRSDIWKKKSKIYHILKVLEILFYSNNKP